jgi:hypothetical protein
MPLSPLMYAVVADLYNMAVINHKCFKGHETLSGQFVKILAYANIWIVCQDIGLRR